MRKVEKTLWNLDPRWHLNGDGVALWFCRRPQFAGTRTHVADHNRANWFGGNPNFTHTKKNVTARIRR